LLVDERIRIQILKIIADPENGGPKTYGNLKTSGFNIGIGLACTKVHREKL
jgi:hypothetical protein